MTPFLPSSAPHPPPSPLLFTTVFVCSTLAVEEESEMLQLAARRAAEVPACEMLLCSDLSGSPSRVKGTDLRSAIGTRTEHPCRWTIWSTGKRAEKLREAVKKALKEKLHTCDVTLPFYLLEELLTSSEPLRCYSTLFQLYVCVLYLSPFCKHFPFTCRFLPPHVLQMYV